MSAYLQLSNKAQHVKQISKSIPNVIKEFPVLTKDDFDLSEDGLSLDQQERAWKKFHDHFQAYKGNMMGYPENQDLHCSDIPNDYWDKHINNAGDPFSKGKYALNTKVMECAVLDYFAKLWNINLRDTTEDNNNIDTGYWGYVVTMGGTEANLYGLYNARDYLSGEPLLHADKTQSSKSTYNGEAQYYSKANNHNAFTPVIFYSQDSHQSLAKASHFLRVSTFHDLGSGHFPCPLTYPDDYPSTYSEDFLDQNGWPRSVPVNEEDGSMHLPSLVKLVSAFASRGYPPIVIFTSGVTFKGSYENAQAAINELVPILKANNLYERHVYHSSNEDLSKFDVRRGFWFHVDGALGAAHLPFLEMAINQGEIDDKFPNGFPVFDFRIPEVMSITMSAQKWLGCPFPSGIYMTRRKNQLKPLTDPFFIGEDTTLSGSRNGHGALILWNMLSKKSHDDFTEQAVKGEKIATLFYKRLQDLENNLGQDLWLSRSPGSLLICFKKARKDIVLKYSLACDTRFVKTKQGTLKRRVYSHICVMSHIREELIEKFISDLMEPGAFPEQS